MKKILITILTLALLSLSITFMFSCNQNSELDNLTGTDAEIAELFQNLYAELNKQNFEVVRDYYGYSEEELTAMVENFKYYATMIKSKYVLESVKSTETEDGKYAATVVTLNTFKSDSAENVIRETGTYILSKESGKLLIIDYANNGMEQVSSK